MFFLSKALSLFVLPLGAACFLIGVSIVGQLAKRFRLAITANITALAILWLMGSRLIAGALLRPLEMRITPPGPLASADAIVVLGGCTEASLSLQSTPHLTQGADRLVYAAQLYREHRAKLIVLSGGGPEGS